MPTIRIFQTINIILPYRYKEDMFAPLKSEILEENAQTIESKQTAKELYDYKQALDASSIVAITDHRGIISYANEKFCEISKYRLDELIGQDHRIINSGYHPAAYIRELWRTIAKGKIWRGEFRNRAKDGSFYWVDTTIVPFLNEEGKPYKYLSIRNDITAKKQQEEKMRAMAEEMEAQKVQEERRVAREIIKAQEEEKNRIGRELHDNVNQILASTKLYLSMAGANNPGTAELVKYPIELIDNSINEIRQLSARQVTPLKNVDLKELISNLLLSIESSSEMKTEFIYEVGSSEPDDDLKLNIYRIVQEQLNNILKHAKARQVTVQIQASADHLLILVTDDGKGFDPRKRRNGIGISNMINRIQSFNGVLKIESSPGAGCRIITQIPFYSNETGVPT